jgi:hypothetical protein
MKIGLKRARIGWLIIVALVATLGIVISLIVLGSPERDLAVSAYSDVVRFEAAGVSTLQVTIYDLSGKKVWDSGMVAGSTVDWDRNNERGERMAYGAYLYVAQGWEAGGELSFKKNGKLALMPGDKVQLQQAPAVRSTTEPSSQAPTSREESRYAPMAYSHTGDFTISGNLGVGTDSPTRKVDVDAGSERVVARFRSSEHPLSMVETVTSGNNASYSMKGPSQEWRFEKIGTSFWQVKDVTADTGPFRIYTGAPWGSITIASSGKVGIGTTNPGATLEVHGSATNLLALYDPVAPTNPRFRVTKTGDVRADGAYYSGTGGFHTGSADVAERINTSEWVEAGNVVEIDTDHPGFFCKSTSAYSTKVVGIISTSPGVILGNNFNEETDNWEDNRPVLAVTGRVPCMVSTENGPIAIGDLLVASSTPGVAMKGDSEQAMGAVVGKAMEPFEEGEGTIVVQVMLR